MSGNYTELSREEMFRAALRGQEEDFLDVIRWLIKNKGLCEKGKCSNPKDCRCNEIRRMVGMENG